MSCKVKKQCVYKKYIHHSYVFSREKAVLFESGEKYAQIKHCLLAKTV